MRPLGVGMPDDLAGPPVSPVVVPAAVARLADGARVEPVWRNNLGGLTFRWADRHAKWQPGVGVGFFAHEAARLTWAAGRTPVPPVVSAGADDEGAWLVTATLPGRSAVDPRWRRDPVPAARAIGAGLRALHDALPVTACPFDWGVAARVAGAAGRGVVVPPALADPPPVDRLVVCHGDPCAPNTLLADDGSWSGHVDLGALGVADRWADLAVATWSLGWNYGEDRVDVLTSQLLDAYDVAPDPVRTAYYRALWDAT